MELFHLLDISKSISVMEVGRQECPPGHAWSLYLLDRTVIHYVESGKGTYVCSGKTFHLKKGDAFYIPTHTRGRYQADEADPWRYTWIYFGGNTGDKFYEDLGLSKAAPIYTSSNPELVNESIGRLEQQAAAGGTYAVMSGLYSVLDAMTVHNSNQALGKRKSGEEYVAACKSYIMSKSCEKITVSDLCGLVKIDRTYLYRLFQEHFKMGPKEYILKTKLDMASQLLTESPLSVSEVAGLVGYEDPFAFSKQFKQHFGVSPKEYGAKHKNLK
ncbi:AraC family transcriptional regulator [Congzhengia minquanensis]|jgi:AraC family transcriptional regulator of arabinose operon|uniref:AraC family transcriptional regulator n=1 Tax=Congzhengia minquanensis TaxID=2763657 RepID=A0A926DMF6_9FIRM|nr:AraC family transcriptional regulator [Congzhengia minquanensis]MBC8540991.1 AraC family transcriptional regulator [Congzhengia minquanensis]